MKHLHALTATAVAVAALLTGCSASGDGDPAPATAQARDHNDVDVAFATDMIPHHRQAVEMADLASTRAERPQVRQLAAEIRRAQDPEVRTMSRWLDLWGEEVPDESSGMSSMPGMMSAEDLEELAGLSGAAFDRQFLTLMKAHHEGAVSMARQEQRGGRNRDAIALAETIESTQTREVSVIEDLLAGP